MRKSMSALELMETMTSSYNAMVDEFKEVQNIEEKYTERLNNIQSSLDNLESEVNELKEGNIQIDLTNYATKDYVQDAINNAKLEGGDVQVDLSSYAKKTDLHEHSNKTILDSITTSKVNQWDNKSDFSGDYNDLTNKPTIPTKTSQLTNDSNFITSNYVDDALGNAGVTPVYSILKDAKWVVIGDSISDTVDGRTRTDKFYQEFIAENTGCTLVNWNGNGTGYKTEFNGKSYIYNRLHEIPSDANLITIFSGTNDNITLGNYGDTGFDTFYGVVDETVKAIKDKFPLVPLGLITPLPRTSSDLSNTKNKGYSEAIKAIGKKYSVPVLDLYADCGFHVNNNEFKLNCLPDGLHPNINGHAMLSKKIQPWLENVVLTDEYTKYVIRGMGILSASSLGFTSGGTKEFTIALDRVPNENQGIVLQSTNTSVTISPSTIYFNKTAEAKTITLTIPSTVTTSFTINAICNNINIGSITFSNGGTSSGEETDITLSSITATYTQGSTVVYPSTSLDSLKNNLVVKANYSDNSQTTLTSTDYSLSGTLTVGTSTITVTYSEKTTTFIVNVTEEQQEGDISNLEYYVNLDFTNSLNSTSSIANLANSSKNASIASNSSPTWGDGYLSITGGSGITVPNLELTGILEFSYELDCELTNSSLTPTLAYLYGQKGDNNFIVYDQSKVIASPRAYDDGANTYITNIRGNVDKSIRNKITVTYKPSEIKLYANGNLLATATDTTSNYSIKNILVCSSSFTGKIYGFKVYKKCLTNSEILALQNSNNSFDFYDDL